MNAMRRLIPLALAGAALISTAGFALAQQTDITIQRVFGDCGAEYGTSTDVANAHGECGIITTMINKFIADNPDINVTVNQVQWPGYEQLTGQYASGDLPTLVIMHESVISDYASRGLLQPMDEGFQSVGIDPAEFTEAAKSGVTKEGKIYALPIDNHPWLWHINLNLFKQAGLLKDDGTPILPTSVEELTTQAKQFKDATGKPYFIRSRVGDFVAAAYDTLTLLYQQNSTFFADPTHIDLSGPEAKAAVEVFRTLVANGDETPNLDAQAAEAGFVAGEGGVLVSGPWVLDALSSKAEQDANSSLHGGYYVVPFQQIFPGRAATWTDGHSWVMPTHDLSEAQRAAAFKFLKYFWENDFQWARTGHLPASQKVFESAEFQNLPFRKPLLTLGDQATLLPAGVKRQRTVIDLLGEEVLNAVTGQKSTEQALADAQSRINDLLADAQ